MIYLQINRMTSWIDGSFIYSTSEAWVNAMRSFRNGTFKTGEAEGMPPRNNDRVPIFTAPAPHIMRMANPERMLRKFKIFLLNSSCFFCLHLKFLSFSSGRSAYESKSGHFSYRCRLFPLSQRHRCPSSKGTSQLVGRRSLSTSSPTGRSHAAGNILLHPADHPFVFFLKFYLKQ